jgi:hypothetical protein
MKAAVPPSLGFHLKPFLSQPPFFFLLLPTPACGLDYYFLSLQQRLQSPFFSRVAERILASKGKQFLKSSSS